VVLDEKGVNLSSVKWAEQISNWRDDGIRNAVFAIGGADGHSEDVLAAADKTLAFGVQTWPHMLVRAMLAEQLYRAEMILARHPYHHA
jgi:23S rRNA (pseudouridine1915-N3)-methyltransferase